MSTRAEIFEKALEKLKLRKPVPDAIKKFILYNKPKSLVSALKAGGEYSTVYNLILKVYYSFGKAGIGLSIAQSKIILGLAALALAASVSTGAAVANKYLASAPEQIDTESIREDNFLKDASKNQQPGIQEQTGQEEPAADIKDNETIPKPDNRSSPKKARTMIPQEIKKLSVVTTKDGKKYTGSFRASGKNVEVITTQGKIIIPSQNIKNIAPYKGD